MRSTEQCPGADHCPLARFPRTITTRERDPTDRTILAVHPRGPVKPSPARPISPWSRPLDRRDLLKLGAFMAAGGAVAPLLAACSTPSPSQAAAVGPTSGS